MGSQSDWQTMKHAAETLDALGVPSLMLPYVTDSSRI